MNGETTNEVMTHFTMAGVIVYGLEYLKSSGWFPWLTCDTKTLNRIVSGVAAIAVAAGINGHWDPANGGTLHIPPLMDLLGGMWDAVKQFTANQLVYDTVFNRTPITVEVQHSVPGAELLHVG